MSISTITSYLQGPMRDPDTVIRKFHEWMESAEIQFDTLIGTGFSGSILVPMLARDLGLDYALVRKAGVTTHASNQVEGVIGDRWLFVDDCIASGDTFRHVVERVHELCRVRGHDTQFVGLYEYDAYGNVTEIHFTDPGYMESMYLSGASASSPRVAPIQMANRGLTAVSEQGD